MRLSPTRPEIELPNQDGAARVMQTAAQELQRYLWRLNAAAVDGAPVTLRIDSALDAQAYRLRAENGGLTINGGDAAGVLYGVYALLERLGVGFYNGGERLPELPADLALPDDLDEAGAPAFGVRGNMLHYNFLCGPTCWGLADYQFYFDQLARQRMNLLLMHWYDGEPGAPLREGDRLLAGGPTPSACDKPWGGLDDSRTADYPFRLGRYFLEDEFTSPMGDGRTHPMDEIRRAQAMFREATDYAARRGIRVAAGFEAPSAGDPTDATDRARFVARLEQFLEAAPNISYVALWQHESGGCVGSTPPDAGTPAAALLAEHREHFAYLGTDRRVWEAIRYGSFARLAHETLQRRRPDLPLVVVGWGGDRWMRFADYCLGYDRDGWLPADVIFNCHENIQASVGPNVSTPWGQLPPERERWAMPWVEGDTNDCWTRQPAVEPLGQLCPDALAKGCQGLLNLQWRTRDIEEENGFTAQFAWDPTLTPARFYERYARHSFGPEFAAQGASIIARLQGLGARWTGVRGSIECGGMHWAGWGPDFPIELDQDALDQLASLATKAADELAKVPADAGGSAEDGAFHLQTEGAAVAGTDESRLGVAEFRAAAASIATLSPDPGDACRAALDAIEQPIYPLRDELIRRGMSTPCYRAVDGFLIILHYVHTVAGYAGKSAALAEIRAEVADRLAATDRQSRPDRHDCLNYLLASIDFVTHYDRVAVLLRASGDVAPAIDALDENPDADQAAALYTRIVEAGMREALDALCRKLTTRCDWGVLATVIHKPLALYRQTLDRLSAHMPVAPPPEIWLTRHGDEFAIAWPKVKGAASYQLYRRGTGNPHWESVGAPYATPHKPVMVDTPPAAGTWVYAVSAIDRDGWESPKSHPECLADGSDPTCPLVTVVAPKPPSEMDAQDSSVFRLAVVSPFSDRTALNVVLDDGCSGAGVARRRGLELLDLGGNRRALVIPSEQKRGLTACEIRPLGLTWWPPGASSALPVYMDIYRSSPNVNASTPEADTDDA